MFEKLSGIGLGFIHEGSNAFYYEVQNKFGETDERRVGLHSKSLLNAKYTESGPRENDFSILVYGKNSNTQVM